MLWKALPVHRLLEELMTKTPEQSEVVTVFDLAPIDAAERAESFKFRVEVLKVAGRKQAYYARIYRWETFRLQPTFPIIRGRPKGFLADQELLVVDDSIGASDFRASSSAAVVRKVRKRIAEVFAGRKTQRS